jgi:CO/xanthine dehydrogenase FAD-binding subunit
MDAGPYASVVCGGSGAVETATVEYIVARSVSEVTDLLRVVVRHIGHPPIRARGTMLGSLAYAHPAAE